MLQPDPPMCAEAQAYVSLAPSFLIGPYGNGIAGYVRRVFCFEAALLAAAMRMKCRSIY